MVSKEILKSYELDNMYAYLDIILNSKINGQFTQARQQYKRLSKEQKLNFYLYLHELGQSEDILYFITTEFGR